MSGRAVPGVSADYAVKALGLEPRLSAVHWLWFCICQPLGGFGHGVRALSLFSAVCGAVSVFFVARILWHAVRKWCERREFEPEKGRTLAQFSALAGGSALAVSPAFVQAATRVHVGTFNVLLLSAGGLLFVRFVARPSLPRALLVTAWTGFCATQSTAFLWLALPVAACCLVLFRRARFRLGRAAALAFGVGLAAFVVGFILQLVSYIGTEGHRLTGFLGLYSLAVETLRSQYHLALQNVTQSGWLLAALTLVFPGLFCAGFMAFSRRSREPQGKPAAGDAAGLHALATLITCCVLLNAPFTVWNMYGEKLPWLSPYVFVALGAGWLAAYWFQLVERAVRSQRRTVALRVVRRANTAVTATVCVLLAGACLLSWRSAAQRANDPASAYAEEVVRATGGREWLLTGGNLDNLLLLAAREQGQRLRVVNVVRMNGRLYREYVSSRFETPQLRLACKFGFTPLVREWFGNGSNRLERVAVMSLPDVWAASGRESVPTVLVFAGAAREAQPAVADVWQANQEGWLRLEPLLEPRSSDLPGIAAFRNECRRHASLVANNLGAWLEERGETALAAEAYLRARSFEPYNVSALLNLGSLVQRGAATNLAALVRGELAQLRDAAPRLDWWSLNRRYGVVRSADAYGALGDHWTLSGQPGIGAAYLKKAARLDPGASAGKWELKQALAFEQDGRTEESLALYERRLRDAPDDAFALLGLARLSLATNGVAAACEWLGRLERQASLPSSRQLAVAELYFKAGEWGRARSLAQTAVERDYDDLSAWAMLAGIAIEQRDKAVVERCLREFLRLEKGRGFNTAVTEALTAMGKGELAAARALFEEALRYKPQNVETLERILRLDQLLGPRPATEADARRQAVMDSRNATAPYVLGALHLRAGEWAAAQTCLEKSVSLAPLPEALNDLAWVNLQRGDLTEAERYARQAIARCPKLAAAWDTLGVILTRSGRTEEAGGALERALAFGGRQPLVLAHLARVRLAMGNRPEARLLLGEIKQLKRPLAAEEAAEIQAVRELLNKK